MGNTERSLPSPLGAVRELTDGEEHVWSHTVPGLRAETTVLLLLGPQQAPGLMDTWGG